MSINISPRSGFAYLRVAVLCLVLVSVFAYAYLPQAPVLYDIDGVVKVYDATKNEWIFPTENMYLDRNDIVKTFADGSADLRLSGEYAIRLKSNTEVDIGKLVSRASRDPLELRIAKGTVFAYVIKKKFGAERVVKFRTEDLVTVAIDANFMIEKNSERRTSAVMVMDGIVRVERPSVGSDGTAPVLTVTVDSGQKFEISAGRMPKHPGPMRKSEWSALEELYSVGKKSAVALHVSTGPTRTKEILAAAPLYISEKGPGVLPEKLVQAARGFKGAVKPVLNFRDAETVRMVEETIREHPDRTYDMPLMIFIGAYYESINAHDKAIEIFGKAIAMHPSSSLASVAQLATGYIYEKDLADWPRAETAYRSVISCYPQSPEVGEALDGLRRIRHR